MGKSCDSKSTVQQPWMIWAMYYLGAQEIMIWPQENRKRQNGVHVTWDMLYVQISVQITGTKHSTDIEQTFCFVISSRSFAGIYCLNRTTPIINPKPSLATRGLHYSDTWSALHLKSPSSQLFVPQLVQAYGKENINDSHYWPFVRCDQWIPLQQGPAMRKAFPYRDAIMSRPHQWFIS